MKLVKIESKNERPKKPFISVSPKGTISLSKLLATAMKLKHGDNVAFYMDEEKPMDWYLKPNDNGIILRNVGQKSGGLMLNSSSISKQILQTIKKERATMLVSTEPTKDGFYAIITKSAK
jgi:hypothetical protein